MATFEQVYGMSLEFGHNLKSRDNLVCKNCGEDFEPGLKSIMDYADKASGH